MKRYDVQKVDFLKIDVEGHELEVLRGGNRFLNICRHIAIETHERQGCVSNSQIKEFLEKHGFKTELIVNPRFKKNDIIYGWYN